MRSLAFFLAGFVLGPILLANEEMAQFFFWFGIEMTCIVAALLYAESRMKLK